jgi:hypothetical protein
LTDRIVLAIRSPSFIAIMKHEIGAARMKFARIRPILHRREKKWL